MEMIKNTVVTQLIESLGSKARLFYRKEVVDIHIWPIFRFLNKDEIENIEVALVYNKQEGNSAIYVTKNDDVFTIGRNNDYLLGNDQWPDSFNARRVDQLCGKKIKYFSCGSDHVLALTEDGIVYSWGANDLYQLGTNKIQRRGPSIVEGLSDKKVIQIASSASYNFVLCDDSTIYEWGLRQSFGDDERENAHVPTLVGGKLQGEKIVSIACSETGSYALTANGCIYSWGVCLFETRGYDNACTEENNNPSKIPNLDVFIKKIVAGEHHILALSERGTVYAWGLNDNGQSGDNDICDEGIFIHPVEFVNSEELKMPIIGKEDEEMNISQICVQQKYKPKKIIDIATSPFSNTCAALDNQCKVWMWGDCKGQKLGSPVLTNFKSMHEVFVFCSRYKGTYCPITSRDIEKKSINHHVGNSFNDQTTSDLTIIVEGKEINVHSGFLKIRSTYFKNMFRAEWKRNEKDVLKILDSTYLAYKALLEYFYTNTLNVESDSAFEVLELARKYGEEELQEMCKKVIKNSIRLENVTSAYVTSKNMHIEDITTFCLKFMMNNLTNVVSSDDFPQLNASVMAEILQEASSKSIFKT